MSDVAGILGCGTIGREVIFAIDNDQVPGASIGGIHSRDSADAASVLSKTSITDESIIVSDPLELTETCDVVIECASHEAVEAYAVPILERGTDFYALSVGALADEKLHETIIESAASNDAVFEVPSGALAGVDAIRASTMQGQLEEVLFITTKPPAGLSGAPHIEKSDIDISSIETKTKVFQGSAREAAPAFPANINVSIALSLAGLGADETVVEIWADPAEENNIHEIKATGGMGTLDISFSTAPHPENPKTSYIAVLSALASLKRRTASFVIGT